MSGLKRHFPGTEKEQSVSVKKRGVGEGVSRRVGSTNFCQWTDEQLKGFLTQRGEDFDESLDRSTLLALAVECEFNTGLAKMPPPAQEQAQAQAEVDPLDAFMAEIDQQVEADIPNASRPEEGMGCDEVADPVADFLEARRTGAVNVAVAMGAGYNSDDDVYATAKAADGGVDMEYDSDDNPIVKKRAIEPLPALDHSEIEYPEFAKDFYDVHREVAKMTDEQLADFLKSHQLKISGYDAPRPVQQFNQCGFGPALMSVIKKQGFAKPTPIQLGGLPAALSGRDILGVAKTGSGKTAAFVLPMIVHIMAQPELSKGEGPVAVIAAPTRELAEQIHKQARIFGKPYGLKITACFGGLRKYDQLKELKLGAEVMVGTPGRIIDLIKMKACNMRRATYLVFDEADRMFDMGFEPQIRSIMGQIRPDRQTMLFSATMPHRVERLARDALTSPVRITVGAIGAANEDIRQSVAILANDTLKYHWLMQRLQRFVDEGDVLIFANKKARVEEVLEKLKAKGYRVDAIHGDLDQHSRMEILKKFREGSTHVLVATDVASRGLDIRSIKTVVNFDAAKDIDGHVHRIGRTGRAGDKDGTAYTLVAPQEVRFAGSLVQSLTAAGQEVPRELHDLAMKDGRFNKNNKRGKGVKSEKRRPQVGGAGLGFSTSQSNPTTTTASRTPPQYQPPSMMFAPASDSSQSHHMPPPPAGPTITPPASNPNPPGAMKKQMQHDDALKSYHQGMFRSQFVKSGVTGGDLSAAPIVVAPKVLSSRPVPPPPTPVTEKPIVSTPQPLLPQRRAVMDPPVVTKTPEFSAAFAAAQAIAARLGSGFPSDSSNASQDGHDRRR
ncbi:hypothetical protein BSKO_08510 [Bryopsis sp. KO-2023]|nr:hypothetical protein BSKO_08510 [Bryopsis sp. KO-2023]